MRLIIPRGGLNSQNSSKEPLIYILDGFAAVLPKSLGQASQTRLLSLTTRQTRVGLRFLR
jgi:hypothetical protein